MTGGPGDDNGGVHGEVEGKLPNNVAASNGDGGAANPARLKGGTAAERRAFQSIQTSMHTSPGTGRGRPPHRPQQDVYNRVAKTLTTPSRYQFGGGFGIPHNNGGRAQTAVGVTNRWRPGRCRGQRSVDGPRDARETTRQNKKVTTRLASRVSPPRSRRVASRRDAAPPLGARALECRSTADAALFR